jgi:hypothetical protein
MPTCFRPLSWISTLGTIAIKSRVLLSSTSIPSLASYHLFVSILALVFLALSGFPSLAIHAFVVFLFLTSLYHFRVREGHDSLYFRPIDRGWAVVINCT